MFLRFRRRLASKRKDLIDFAVRSASFVELALRVNFIITVIKEDVSEKLGSFLKQVLQSSAMCVTKGGVKMRLHKDPLRPTSYRYYEIYPIILVNPDPIRW